jgi:hypothetical protein
VNQALALLTHPEGRHGDGPQLFQPVKFLRRCCQDQEHSIKHDISHNFCLLQTLDSPMFLSPLTSLIFKNASSRHAMLRV